MSILEPGGSSAPVIGGWDGRGGRRTQPDDQPVRTVFINSWKWAHGTQVIFSDDRVAARVRELALVASRAALRPDWDGGERDLEVRRTVRAVCDVARSSGAQIEQLLIALKETWRGLPENGRRTDLDLQGPLACIVTICIHEYYRPWEQS